MKKKEKKKKGLYKSNHIKNDNECECIKQPNQKADIGDRDTVQLIEFISRMNKALIPVTSTKNKGRC
jgi:hypothetical protein